MSGGEHKYYKFSLEYNILSFFLRLRTGTSKKTDNFMSYIRIARARACPPVCLFVLCRKAASIFLKIFIHFIMGLLSGERAATRVPVLAGN